MNPYVLDVVEDNFPPVSCEFSVRKKAYICREGSGTPWKKIDPPEDMPYN